MFAATPASATALDVVLPGDTPVAENVPLSEPRWAAVRTGAFAAP